MGCSVESGLCAGRGSRSPSPAVRWWWPPQGLGGSVRGFLCGVWGDLKHGLGLESMPAFLPGLQGARGAGPSGAIGEKAGSPILQAGEDRGVDVVWITPSGHTVFPGMRPPAPAPPCAGGVSWRGACGPPSGAQERPGPQAGQGGCGARTESGTQPCVLIPPPQERACSSGRLRLARLTMALFSRGCCQCRT